jgi:type II secretory pathway pseudopilin PulG
MTPDVHRADGEPPVRRDATSSASGYALLELLVAAAIVCALLGVLIRFCVMAQASVRTQGDRADLQQRLRVAVEAIRRDLMAAGAGPSSGLPRSPLVDVFAPVLPARSGRSGADPEVSYHADRISIVYVPAGASQTRLTQPMAAADGPLLVDSNAPGCPPGNLCGFNRGDHLLVYPSSAGDGSHDVFTVSGADATQALLIPDVPLSRAYPAGSRIATIVERVYYLDRAGRRLMVYDGDRSDVPLVDHVVDLQFTYFADPAPASVTPPAEGASNCAYASGAPPVPVLADLGGTALVQLSARQLTDGPVCGLAPRRFDVDLMRVRRIGVSLRIEAEGAEFRGSGPSFANPGTSRDADRYIPDLQVTFEVAPRNMLNTGLR